LPTVTFEITHLARYVYNQPVFLEPHLLRVRPRVDGGQSLDSFRLIVKPQPAGLSTSLDAEGNVVSLAWFNGLSSELTVRAESIVTTTRNNPFEFILPPNRVSLPMSYSPVEEPLVATACKRVGEIAGDDPVGRFAADVAAEVNQQVVPFLGRLSERLSSTWRVTRRESGAPWSALETFSRRTGACRDLVVLFMDACRSVGLAARFVSGYQQQSTGGEYDLHAWAEVYLPWAGWRGYDPSQGLAVADQHIALAASARPEQAAAVVGSYRGMPASATLTTSISISGSDGSQSFDRGLQSQQQVS
jgi:transglutaminase-like putative cysteine protease